MKKTRARPTPKPDDPEQSRRFEEAARKLEADETAKTFGRTLERVVAIKRKLTKGQE